MTTRVRVLNEGPDAIEVECQDRDSEGRFADGGEAQRVEPRQYLDVYVHSTRNLLVREIK